RFVTHSVTEAVFMSKRVVVMSGRPGRVLGDFTVPFDYPRLPPLRFDEDFAHLAGKVSICLREGREAAWPASGTPPPAPVPAPEPAPGRRVEGIARR
ncbi:MAG: hypothetical protein L0Y54_24165, partial [Sporichthyaceae bacterium]|nr:hypothetical protein [Sporichthyaceae bacterium]